MQNICFRHVKLSFDRLLKFRADKNLWILRYNVTIQISLQKILEKLMFKSELFVQKKVKTRKYF